MQLRIMAMVIGWAVFGAGRTTAYIDPVCSQYPLLCPLGSAVNVQAPEQFVVEFATNVGTFQVQVIRQWSPHGADRVFNLVQQHFYDSNYFYRVLPNWVAQFGVSPNPTISSIWTWQNNATYGCILPVEPLYQGVSNQRGYVAYSTEYDTNQQAVNATTQLFINYRNNSRLDSHGFVPFGYVLGDGMSVVDTFYSGYGEVAEMCNPPNKTLCPGPSEGAIYAQGNAYLAQNYPRLSYIQTATIVVVESGSDTGRKDVDFTKSNVFYGLIGWLVGCIVLVACMVAYKTYRWRKQKRQEKVMIAKEMGTPAEEPSDPEHYAPM